MYTTGIVIQNVQAGKLPHGSSDGCLYIGGAGNIGINVECFTTSVANIRNGLFACLLVKIGNNYFGALLLKQFGRSLPKTAGTAGAKGDFPFTSPASLLYRFQAKTSSMDSPG